VLAKHWVSRHHSHILLAYIYDDYQASSAIAFASIAIVIPFTHPFSSKPQLKARALKLAD